MDLDARHSKPVPQNKEQVTPSISIPKGGGAIRGIGEKFATNPVTGTGSMSVPIAVSPGRSGFSPQLSLSYDSGAGNGPFGLGWSLASPGVTRKTDKGLPRYRDAEDSDVFILSGAEDLVPVSVEAAGQWQVRRYRPRTEGLFSRIERWTDRSTGDTHWRSITRDNVTTIYGSDNNSRIYDPGDANPQHPARIFSWLICASYDDRGNAMVYEYQGENSAGVDPSQAHEGLRTAQGRTANRYLKRIKYGNRVSRLVEPDLSKTEWLFEVVFDYAEGHYAPLPIDADGRLYVNAFKDGTRDWSVRCDPFSSYRAGFEVRTYRLCRRVLMFHHFEELDTPDCLVRSTEFTYDEGPVASFITDVSQSGYTRKSESLYLKKSLPPLHFTYSEASLKDEVRQVDPTSLENLPGGLDGSTYQFVDLDGEGVSGILTEQADAWFYKPNLGGGQFGPIQRVRARPSLANLSGGGQQLLDLDGDGHLDLTEFSGPTPGFFERTPNRDWKAFKRFRSLPNIPWDDPNLRFVDLTGDGHADILITEDNVFTWYESLAEDGFSAGEAVVQALDEDKSPRLVFADGTQSIYLADFSGDGLTDLARIRNGEVCYWPNLGYGRFGAKVVMDNAPQFDTPDQFSQRRIRLADIDGSGTTDIIYLGGDGAKVYRNLSGNAWSDAETITSFPRVDDLSSVMAVDLLGNGTACLVWSSSLPGDGYRRMCYIDLMGGQKPHLLISVINNLGAETKVRYAPSTKFYLADKLAGKPWITRLSFPVHVVERVETYDYISRNLFVSRYAYHHGYFDGIEREFRGFGLVEQWDTETLAALSASDAFPACVNVDAASHVPPVLTKTWFHTGAFTGGGRISRHFERGYHCEPALRLNGPDDPDRPAKEAAREAQLLPDTILPAGLSAAEAREACRALRGSVLRQETYALNGTGQQSRPYSVSERNYTVTMLQPQGTNQHAVFFVHPRETLDYHYERTDPPDPRISHQMVLEVDDFGNTLKSVSIGYGRLPKIYQTGADGRLKKVDNPGLAQVKPQDQPRQTQTLITYTENSLINRADEPDWYRVGLPYESRTFELTGYTAANGGRFAADDFIDSSQNPVIMRHDGDLAFEELPSSGRQWRLIGHSRTLYRADNLTGPLTAGEIDSMALPYDTYKLAFTAGLVSSEYKRPQNGSDESLITDSAKVLGTEGGYVHSQGDADWWAPAGQVFYSPDPAAKPADERAEATAHFYVALRYEDPFGNPTLIEYDGHDLLVKQTRDAADNVTSAVNDYRVLLPRLITDPNGNQTEVAFDTLGLVVGTAAMGKPGEGLGDTLAGFDADLTDTAIAAHISYPLTTPHTILGQAGSRLVYDLFAYMRTAGDAQPQPAVVYSMARETHQADLAESAETEIQHTFAYSDGFGREVQKKLQARPGPLVDGGTDVSPRWVGSGWTIFNNKGKPVRKYEPFFSDTHSFEFARVTGVSPVLFYDPVERVVGTLHPNSTYEKVAFDPWRQETWDVNDTVLQPDPRQDADIGDFFVRLLGTGVYLSWYEARKNGDMGADEKASALQTAAHADTPSVAHLDSLGRIFLTVTHNRKEVGGADEYYEMRVALDIQGNQREVTDALGRTVMRYDYDILNNRIHHASMEGGARWTVSDVLGKAIYAWDSRAHTVCFQYDGLRRPTKVLLTALAGSPALVEQTIYGDTLTGPEAQNLRGKTFQVYDGAGVVTNVAYDFKGNLLHRTRRLVADASRVPDWSLSPNLETETYEERTRYDALDRAIQVVAPHSDRHDATFNILQPGYDEASLLERVDVWLGQSSEPSGLLDSGTATLKAVKDIDRNARGQRLAIEYGVKDAGGNEKTVRTAYTYDPLTYRLTGLVTNRPDSFAATERKVQDLTYTYDPAGNITHIGDAAQPTVFFSGQVVRASNDYLYDALYRLIGADGREHPGQVSPPQTTWNDAQRVGLPHPQNGQAMRRYCDEYLYDAVGNIEQLLHHLGDLPGAGQSYGQVDWKRTFAYDEPSQINASQRCNRLTSATVEGITDPFSTNQDGYDPHGNMLGMPHLPLMLWDYKDQLRATAQQIVNDGVPQTTYYAYDSRGQRVRKITESALTADDVAAGREPVRVKERLYLGISEVYREYDAGGNSVTLDRETLHLMDDKQRIGLVETRTDDGSLPLVRCQLGNHLGSAALELDGQAQIISYEEYYPYGSTSYQGVRSQTEAPKRYRYTGKERDEESGLYYHSARYYAPWLMRWTSVDPVGIQEGTNLYSYAHNAPIGFVDASGLAPSLPVQDVARGLSQLDALAEYANKAESKAEYALNATSGQVNEPEANMPSVRAMAFVPKGDIAIGHTHLERDLTNMFDYNTTKEQGVEAGDYRRNVIARGGGNFSVMEVNKQTGKGSYTELNIRSGEIHGTAPVDPSIDSPMRPVDVENMASRGKSTLLRTPERLARALLGSKPFSKVATSGSFLSKAGSVARGAAATVKQGIKSMIPGSEFYDELKAVGGGSVRTGVSIAAQTVRGMAQQAGQLAQQGAQAVRQYGAQAVGAVGAAASAVGGSVSAAFGASSITGATGSVVAAGTGAVAVAAVAVTAAAVAGVAVGYGINKLVVEPLVDKLVPQSFYDWSYKTFFK